MVEHLIENRLLRCEQHGFMPHKSCSTNLINSLDIITDALNKGKFIDIIYTDFSKAFDKINHRLLCKKLLQYGFDSTIYEWIREFLKDMEKLVILAG